MRYILAIFFVLPAWACVPLEGDHILGKDLAAAKTEFASLDATVEIGFSPRPGVTRVLPASELLALARKFGIATNGPMTSVCFVRTLPARVPVTAQQPVSGPDVRRGERVSVEVTSGAALLRFEADAESGGRTGDFVLIRNPETGKLFQALMEGKGKVIVQR